MSFIQARPLATHDFYAQIHKGLRFALTKLLLRLGACEAGDAETLTPLLADLRQQLHFSEHHLANEDMHVHTALETRAPGASSHLAQGHAEHRHTFVELEGLIDAVDAARTPASLRALYLRYSTFVADDFVHMAEEEQQILPVLQSLFTDGELQEIEGRIIAGLDPADLVAFGQFMLPAATHSERLHLCGGIQANAPPQAFAAIMEHSAKPSLTARDYARLCEALGVAA